MAKKEKYKKPSAVIQATPENQILSSENAPTWMIVIFWILLALSVVALFITPWNIVPISQSHKITLEWPVIKYNLKLLMQWKGGYAKSIWGFLTFFSMSAWFYLTGKFLFKKILTFGLIDNTVKESHVTYSTTVIPVKTGIHDYESQLSNGELISCRWFLGSWVWGIVWLVLGVLGLYKKEIGYSITFLGLPLFLFYLNRVFFKGILKQFVTNLKFDFITVAMGVIGLWVLSWSALMVYPPYYWDTLMINLALPGYYVAEGKFTPNMFHIYSYFHQNSEMLTVWTLLVDSREAAFLVVWGFFVMLIVFIYGWLARITSRFAAFCAIAAFLSSQLSIWLGTYIKNDLQVAVFLIFMWWALMSAFRKYIDKDENMKNWLFLSGVFAGIALGHKLIAAPMVLVVLIGILIFFFWKNELSIAKKFSKCSRLQAFAIYSLWLAPVKPILDS